jgi:hypothetical protein
VIKVAKTPSKTPSGFDLNPLRHGRWALALERLAVGGLPEKGSLAPVCHEMAKWLYWIEWYGLPENERKAQIIKALHQYVASKHNGHCSRVGDEAGEADIKRQIENTVALAIRLDPAERAQSLELFARVRQKRDSGQYRRRIEIADLLTAPATGVETPAYSPPAQAETANPLSLSWSTCMSIHFEGLPEGLRRAINQAAGRLKLHDFAAKLLHLLAANKGSMNLGEKQLCGLLGYQNGNRVRKYRQVLIDAGLLILGRAYSTGAFAKRHSLTKKCKALLEQGKRTEDKAG